MNYNLKFLCVLAILLFASKSVYIEVDQQPFCLVLDPIDRVDYKIFYESFEAQSTLNTVIKSNDKIVMLEGQTNETIINGSQQILFCLKTKSQQVQNVFIDFYPTQQSKYKKLALKSQVNGVHQQLINIGATLKQINHLQQFWKQRQQIYSQIIRNHQESIHFYGLIKSAVLVGVIFAQFIYLRKKISMQKIKEFFNF